VAAAIRRCGGFHVVRTPRRTDIRQTKMPLLPRLAAPEDSRMHEVGRIVLISGLCVALIALLWQLREPCPKSFTLGGVIMASCK
jgi:hypothetical protein